ncbi:MAG: GlsB/YeaQ/YmgE family stress response membrane protein [Anaerolineae bacterium]|jgi:uncharacterized membrane protein YeaQ/YmgE (transglycosylase-associated protein family)|nr:GlsB/YeaQ/YmgE family stress response membrane protein [Chloroflexota bacterium]
MDFLGLLIQLIVTIIIVAIAEKISKTEVPYGWIGNIIAGLIGGWLGQILLGNTWGPSLGGVLIVQTFIGALVLIAVVKWLMKTIKARRA